MLIRHLWLMLLQVTKNIGTKAALSVDELISLHCGKVTSAQADIPDEASKHDINMLWQEVSANPEIWNKTISNLHEFQNKSGNDKKTNSYYLDFNEIAEKTVDFEEKSKRVAQLLRNLAKTEIQAMLSFISFPPLPNGLAGNITVKCWFQAIFGVTAKIRKNLSDKERLI